MVYVRGRHSSWLPRVQRFLDTLILVTLALLEWKNSHLILCALSVSEFWSEGCGSLQGWVSINTCASYLWRTSFVVHAACCCSFVSATGFQTLPGTDGKAARWFGYSLFPPDDHIRSVAKIRSRSPRLRKTVPRARLCALLVASVRLNSISTS